MFCGLTDLMLAGSVLLRLKSVTVLPLTNKGKTLAVVVDRGLVCGDLRAREGDSSSDMVFQRGDGIEQRVSGGGGKVPDRVVADRGDRCAAITKDGAGINADRVVLVPREKAVRIDTDDVLVIGQARVVGGQHDVDGIG
jgi:hypothetical protein